MKHLIVSICVAISFQANAQYIDLTGGQFLTEPVVCRYNQRQKMCAIVEKDNKHYIVMFDEKGEYSIHEVKLKVTGNLVEIMDKKFLWSRDMV